ncbi:MAG TPA: hypothetical protein VI136_04085 [Verrucomicrobiae bacterium]
MIDPRQIAAGIVGAVDWQSEVSGFCRCPGEALHTSHTGKKDCRVNVDGAPTIFCFHASCALAVAEANRRLRGELNASPWALTLPGGRVLRSGDVLQASGEVLPREVIQAQARAEGRDASEAVTLATVKMLATRFAPELFERFHWPFAQIIEDSPLLVSERDAEDQFRTWLRLWPAHCHVWIGDVFSSGKPEHRTHFRPLCDWHQIGPVMGNYTCGSSFKPGSFRRSNENLNGHRFMVIESDTLAKDDVGAVFAYLRRRLHYRLHCIIDTAGKSLHAWFDAPKNKVLENRLKAGLVAFGCDPKVFTYSQPVRVPGAYREGKLQRLVWLKD